METHTRLKRVISRFYPLKDFIQGICRPLYTDKGFPGTYLPVAGKAAVAASTAAAVLIGKQNIEAGALRPPEKPALLQSQADRSCQAGLYVFRAFLYHLHKNSPLYL